MCVCCLLPRLLVRLAAGLGVGPRIPLPLPYPLRESELVQTSNIV